LNRSNQDATRIAAYINGSCHPPHTLHSSIASHIRCGPCKFIGPIFERLAGENPDIEFVKIDVDQAEEVAGHCGIQAMPTFQFYKNGEILEEMRGADVARLEQLISKYK
jgi:thiol-disulfide isomerase/thioredoxin